MRPGCGGADGTSHGEMAVGRRSGCFRREERGGFGPGEFWVPVGHG